jgi:hypothetical protein
MEGLNSLKYSILGKGFSSKQDKQKQPKTAHFHPATEYNYAL